MIFVIQSPCGSHIIINQSNDFPGEANKCSIKSQQTYEYCLSPPHDYLIYHRYITGINIVKSVFNIMINEFESEKLMIR